jgi:hypothetical protein
MGDPIILALDFALAIIAKMTLPLTVSPLSLPAPPPWPFAKRHEPEEHGK